MGDGGKIDLGIVGPKDILISAQGGRAVNIVVGVKVVPDTAAQVRVEDGKVTWGEAPLVLNPWDEFAVEAALQAKEKFGGQVTVISMGDEAALEALRRALAMGCQQAIRIYDEPLAQADVLVTAQVLSAAIRKLNPDLVIFGRQAIDGDTASTPAAVAQVLGWPFVGLVTAFRGFDEGSKTLEVVRTLDEAKQTLRVPLPAVLTIAKEFAEPRYPSFIGIRKASRAKIPVWNLAELGLEIQPPRVTWPEVMQPPQREVVCQFIEGETPREIARKLVDKLIEEKVL